MGLLERFRRWLPDEPGDDPELHEPQTAPEQHQVTEGAVLRLLVKNDGCMEQSTLLEVTGWTPEEAETVLSAMETSDEIRLLSRGETVLICRPGYEPEGHQAI